VIHDQETFNEAESDPLRHIAQRRESLLPQGKDRHHQGMAVFLFLPELDSNQRPAD
jgi:hypothetical protein